MYSFIASLSIFFAFFIVAFFYQRRNYLPHISASSIEKRYYFIDGIRGVAAVCVVIGHSWRIGARWIDISDYTIEMGGFIAAIGVQVFFCITGFLFIDQVIKRNAIFDWKKYFLARIKRLFPLFIVTTTVCVLIIYSESYNEISNISYQDIKNTIKLYTFGFFGGGVVTINGIDSSLLTIMHWTLPFEWRFYISVPILCIICSLLKTKSPVMLFLALALITYFINGLYFGKWFLTGCISAIIFNKMNLFCKAYRVIISTTGICFVISLFFIKAEPYGYVNFIFVSIFFVSIIISRPEILKARTLIYIGEASYGIYLLHTIVMFTVPLAIYLLFGEIKIKSFIAALSLLSLISVIICALSLFSFKHIEYPFLKKKNN